MRLNHEYQQTACKWLTSGFDSSFGLHIGDDTNTKSWLMCVQTTFTTQKRRGYCLATWLIMLGFMDLRQPKVSRLVIVKIMTCKKKFTPPNKYKNRACQILASPPDQYWSDINLTLLCQLANRSLLKSGRDWRWITFSERPGEAGGRRQPRDDSQKVTAAAGEKNTELLHFQIKVHEHKNFNNYPSQKTKHHTTDISSGLTSNPFFQFNSNSVIFNSTTHNKFQFQFWKFQFQFWRFQIPAISIPEITCCFPWNWLKLYWQCICI